MNKLKNIVAIVLLSILIILGFTSTSKAAYYIDNYKVGDEVSFAYQSLDRAECSPGSNVYCIQHEQHMNTDDWRTYTLKNIITIDGRSGTDAYNTEYSCDWNARLAAALHFSNPGWNRQDAIWIYMYNWITGVNICEKNGKRRYNKRN